MSAVISDCKQYRYTLEREWFMPIDFSGPFKSAGYVLWCMLNPSTADGSKDDPTIRRCRGFSAAWGYSRMKVINLYALRATQPTELWEGPEPTGPSNDKHILRLAAATDLIICAWGQPGPNTGRQAEVLSTLRRCGDVHYLRMNKNGCPSHPLYLPKALRPQLWTA